MLRWYDASKRELPWRVSRGLPDPYHVLLSELMLQQTQVATVIPYFTRFLARFPSLADLAEADEQEVLRLWQGLGYYSRARNLQKACRAIIQRHGGVVPRTVAELMELPGVGRYTAGAIASLAYEERAPILDGNVQRVLCRLHAIKRDPREPKVNARLWALAESSLPQVRAGDFNSAMMELGALVCVPRNPQCRDCPARKVCRAAQQGMQNLIPPARKALKRPTECRDVLCIQREGKWLIEQRPATGRWASMWQFVTLAAGTHCRVPIARRILLARLSHELTHRRYVFTAWICRIDPKYAQAAGGRWVTLDEMMEYPLSRPQSRIRELLVAHRTNIAML